MGDPAKVLERKEEGAPVRSCIGCVSIRLVKSTFDGRRVLVCEENLPIGQRCKLFREK